jgi:hypothetical protein
MDTLSKHAESAVTGNAIGDKKGTFAVKVRLKSCPPTTVRSGKLRPRPDFPGRAIAPSVKLDEKMARGCTLAGWLVHLRARLATSRGRKRPARLPGRLGHGIGQAKHHVHVHRGVSLHLGLTGNLVQVGHAQMLKGGVIMDVMNPEQARIAQAAGACAGV